MRVILICILSFAFFSFIASHPKYNERYNQAAVYCLSIQQEFDSIASLYGLESKELLPIVFPECLRYHDFSDQMETTALAYLYVNTGPEGANFSIGRFQMKPTFIESLEDEVHLLKLPNTLHEKFNYKNGSTVKENRSERIWRMSDISWQMNYLCLFYLIMDQKTTTIQWETEIAKISFYASAYNYGFSSDVSEIKSWEKQSRFPYGEYGQNVPYAQLAVNFYLENSRL